MKALRLALLRAVLLFSLHAYCNIVHNGPTQQAGAIDPRNHYLAEYSSTNTSHKRSARYNVHRKASLVSRGPLGCGAGSPCIDGSCCGPKNTCGFGTDFCGKGCQSNCNATAACGRNSLNGNVKCGMNLCCSYYGWCGASADYCTPGTSTDPGCQVAYSECKTHQPLQCDAGAASATKRTIAYYQGGNVYDSGRLCNKVYPEDIKLDKYTHLYWAFAEINPATFEVMSKDPRDSVHYSSFTSLSTKGKVQTWISIGGFDFTTANPKAWSQMVSTKENRAAFINSLVTFMTTYGFQGVDLDWEYPVDKNRGGTPDDMKNLVQLVADMRTNPNFGSKFGVSVTLAPDIWYLQHFDAKGLLQHASWLGFMSYDLHGIWDASVPALGKRVYGQTDIHDIERDLVPLWYDLNAEDMKKVNFGLASYGRGYTLANKACNKADGSCAWTAGSKPGSCTATEGSMSLIEIQALIKEKNLKPVPLDSGHGNSMMKQITWDDQWMGYDDDETIQQKTNYASSRCFGGTMSWSVDLNTESHDDSGTGGGDLGKSFGTKCRWTDCALGPSCGNNELKLTTKYDPDTCEFMVPQQSRAWCCPIDTPIRDCQWRGEQGSCDDSGHCEPCKNNQCMNDETLYDWDHWGNSQSRCPYFAGNEFVGPQYGLCCKFSLRPLQCPDDACKYDPQVCALWDDGGPQRRRDTESMCELDPKLCEVRNQSSSSSLEKRGGSRFPKSPLGNGAFITWKIASYPSAGVFARLTAIAQEWVRRRGNDCPSVSVDVERVDPANPPPNAHTEHPMEAQTLVFFGVQLHLGRLMSGAPTRRPALPITYLNGRFQQPSLSGLPPVGSQANAINPTVPTERIGEAFGSFNNLAPFILAEADINMAKGAIFGLTEPISYRTLQERIDRAIDQTSDDTLQGMFAWIRATVSVFPYCNSPSVVQRMELVRNLVYEQTVLIENSHGRDAEGLSEHWEEFIPDYFIQVEDYAQAWVTDRLRQIEGAWRDRGQLNPRYNDVLVTIAGLRNEIARMKLPNLN